MKLITYSVPVLILLLSFFYNTNPFIVKEEAHQAYDYLNASKKQLRWNDTLTAVAEAKAMDMARRNYTGHIDPSGYGVDHYISESGYELPASSSSSNDCFESLAVDVANGEEAIKTMMANKDFAGWNQDPADIGIGYVRCDVGKYRTYACIIIAKHQ